MISVSIAPAYVVHDTGTVPYSAWGRNTRREGGGLYSHSRGTSPDRGRSNTHSLIRSVLRPRTHFFEDGITRLTPHHTYSERSYTRTHFFEDGITRLTPHHTYSKRSYPRPTFFEDGITRLHSHYTHSKCSSTRRTLRATLTQSTLRPARLYDPKKHAPQKKFPDFS